MSELNQRIDIPMLFDEIEKSQRTLYETTKEAYQELLGNISILNEQKTRLEKELAFFRSKFREPNVPDQEPGIAGTPEKFAPKVSENIF